MQSEPSEPVLLSYATPGQAAKSSFRRKLARFVAVVTAFGSLAALLGGWLRVVLRFEEIPYWVAGAMIAVAVVVSIGLGLLVERVIGGSWPAA